MSLLIKTPDVPPVSATEVISLTQQLIRFNSVSGNEREIAIFVQEYFEKRGISARIVEPVRNRPNVYATIGQGSPRLLFNGHTDTVPIGNGWTCDPFGAEERGGRIYGRGSCDMKAGLAAMMVAAAAAHEGVTSPSGSLLFAAVCDEEVSSLGTRAAIADGIKAPCAVIAEPTELQTICAAKGNCYFTIRVSGRAAHAGSPELGVNAIGAAAKLALAVARHDQEIGIRSHPLLGRPYSTVTRIAGGTGDSAIPDECHITVDRRLLPNETGSSALAELKRSLDRTDVGMASFEVALEMELPAMDLPSDNILVGQIRNAGLQAGAPNRPAGGWSAACDGGHLHRAGIPTVLFGPGSITTQAHRPDESVPIDELVIATQMFASLAVGAIQ